MRERDKFGDVRERGEVRREEGRARQFAGGKEGTRGTRGRQILYFCNLEAHQPQIFRKCYFLYLFHITEKDFF